MAWDVEVFNQANDAVAAYTILALVKRRPADERGEGFQEELV